MLGTAKQTHRKSISWPKNARKRCIKKNFDEIHDRFQKDLRFRDSQIKVGRTEEKCNEMDELAQKLKDRIGIVQYGDSLEESWTWLSKIEDNGKKEVSSDIYEIRILAPGTEIMKETPWSRIRGLNSVNQEL